MAAAADRDLFRGLGEDLIAHLAGQIGSVERLLALVIAQGKAIRARDVRGVVQAVGLIQAELSRREAFEAQRQALLERAAALTGVPVRALTLSAIARHLPAGLGERARTRAAELKGMVGQLEREHAINKALMAVELAFLDHLLGALQPAAPSAYNAAGAATEGQPPAEDLHLLDVEV